MEVVIAVVVLLPIGALYVLRAYYAQGGWRLKRDNAVKESSRSIERQFERPPNEHDLL